MACSLWKTNNPGSYENFFYQANYENQMRETIAIIKFILSRKNGRDFLAACLFLIAFQFACMVYLYKENIRLNEENRTQVIKDNQRYIDFYKKQNEAYFNMKTKVDSARVELEIFKIKKEMK